MNAQAIPLTPAKRSFWPHAIIGYFALAITGIGVFISWAVRQDMDLVRSDYYEQEILFQRHLDAVNRSKPFAEQIGVSYDAGSEALLLRVPPIHITGDFVGKAHLYRPSNARLDQHFQLRPDAFGRHALHLGEVAPGLWKVRLEWTSGGQGYLSEHSLIIGE
jgi:hypothetical protein